jgi:hypothetical protein
MIRELTDEILSNIRATWPSAVVLELSGVGDAAVRPFDRASFNRWLDESLRTKTTADENVSVRHLLHPSPSEWTTVRRRRPLIDGEIVDALCELGGLPSEGRSVSVDPLDDSTPPGVLERAGLTPEKVAELRAQRPGVDHVVVVVPGEDGSVAAAFALGARAQDVNTIRAAAERKSGYAEACHSAALGAVVWCRGEEPGALFERLVCLPALVIAPEILRLGGAGSIRRAKSRR